ncbi:polysaccharide deacetylase family protein [Nocardioides litoris]|uniref:polysaccharide deacetylase family protein n=1 Tax=Nocardioides litoris TaxID=1926648 RepID=UPI001122E59B|nr:polysaccharide deacetylase family protein [Nocardioides litoris]
MPERGPGPAPVRAGRPPLVLMYHGFTRERRTDDPENLFVCVDELERQLSWLLSRGWQPLDLDGYLRAVRHGAPGRPSFLVTIDDGYTSVLDLALPVLERLRVPAVLYVPSHLVGDSAHWLARPKDERLLDADALVHLHTSTDVELGVHGADHTDMRGRSALDLTHQVVGAHDRLADLVGSPLRSFAYPFGAHDPAARSEVARAGFDVAFSVFDDHGRLAVSRVDVNATDTLTSFRIKVQLPHYRKWWTALDRMPAVRRHVRAVATRSSDRSR